MRFAPIFIVIIMIFIPLFFSGCIDDKIDNRTLGYLMNHFSDLGFEDHDPGDKPELLDKVYDIHYDDDSDNTRVWMDTYKDKPLLFSGDLTSNFYLMPGDYFEYNVTIIQRNRIEYIKEFWVASS